jgi:hypothetical protein
MLVALKGDSVNDALMRLAFEKRPSLVIDCGNAADPFRLGLPEEGLDEVYVINAEAIYRFREALRKASSILDGLRSNVLVVTTIGTLFSYNNEAEDKEVIGHCWEIIKGISEKSDVFVGFDDDSCRMADEVWDTQFQARG